MCIALEQRTKKLYYWLINLCNYKYFDVLMAALFFIEAIFFPIPIDPLLILACLKNQAKWWYYATIATLASTIGGITAYYIGALVWSTIGIKIINYFSSPHDFELACHQLALYESWTVLIAGFTPFPYKVMALITGFCHLPISPFIFFSLISRGGRFILIAALAKRYGTNVQRYLDRYGMILLIIFILICIVSYRLCGLKLG